MQNLPTAALDPPPADPFGLFARWHADAVAHERHDPTAMTLATADDDGRVSARIVLLKHHGPRGFVFYTNLGSRKSRQLEANPRAALSFWFPVLQRAIRIEGVVERVPDDEADAYFGTRPRGSQVGAWASVQSAPLDDRATLEERIAGFEDRFEGGAVPRPAHWGGWLLVPDWFEFWHEGEARLHDRIAYTVSGGGWTPQRLYP